MIHSWWEDDGIDNYIYVRSITWVVYMVTANVTILILADHELDQSASAYGIWKSIIAMYIIMCCNTVVNYYMSVSLCYTMHMYVHVASNILANCLVSIC